MFITEIFGLKGRERPRSWIRKREASEPRGRDALGGLRFGSEHGQMNRV